MKQDKYKLSEMLLWPLLVLILLVSLFAALHWYLSLDLDGFSLADFAPGLLLLALLCHLLALLATTLAWHWSLRLNEVRDLSLLQSMLMVGLGSIGKYAPGKIWGLIARGLALYRLTRQQDKVVLATLTEQVALLHSGLILAALSYCLQLDFLPGVFVVLLLTLPSVWLLARGGMVMQHILHLLDRKKQLGVILPAGGFRKSYPLVFCCLCCMWCLVILVLWFCIKAYGGSAQSDLVLVALTTLLSYLGGFAAFFAPAGLGVREGIVVAMLGPQLGVSAALYISLLQRLITAGFDVALGLAALLFMKTHPPAEEA